MNISKLVLALGLTLALGALPSCRSNEDPTPTPTPKPQSGIVIKNGVLSAYPEKEIKDGAVGLPEVTTINAKVFEGYKTLKKVEAPKLTKVEAAAFKGCTALTSLTLGSTIPAVADDAFEGTPSTVRLSPRSSSRQVSSRSTPQSSSPRMVSSPSQRTSPASLTKSSLVRHSSRRYTLRT